MKKLISAISALVLAFVTLVAGVPAQANGVIVVTPSTLNPSHSEEITVNISGLDPSKQYELGVVLGHGDTIYSDFFLPEVLLDVFTPTIFGTHSWAGPYAPVFSGIDLDALISSGSMEQLLFDAGWGLFPSKIVVSEVTVDPMGPLESFSDFAGVSAQMYPSSQNGVGTFDYSGAGYVDGKFIAGQEVIVTGTGWGASNSAAILGAVIVPKVSGEATSLTFWREYIENGVFNQLFNMSASLGVIEDSFTVPELPAGEYALWIYYLAFDVGSGNLSLRQHRAAYGIGYTVDMLTTTNAESPEFTDETLVTTATVGAAYSDGVAASGTDVVYSIEAGLLPDGLSLNPTTGALTGTPTIAGEYSFRVRAENEAGYSVVDFTIVVSDPDEEILVEKVSRNQFVFLDGFPRWYSVNKDICHVAQNNIVVFTNVGRCVVSTRDSGNSNSDRVFRVTGKEGESGDGRVNAFEVYFAKGSSVLTEKAMGKLSNRAAKFKNQPVVVYGYSAGKKSPVKADRLANRRAKAVASFLEDKSVSVTMVRGVGSAFQNKKKSWKNKRALIQISRFVS